METFLGTGWSFPPTFIKSGRGVLMVSNEEDVAQSLGILLQTGLEERVMRPDFGCELQEYVYENLNARLVALLKDRIKEAILNHESRVDLNTIDILEDQEEGTILIKINYTIRQTNTRFNYVFPYYINEGTHVE